MRRASHVADEQIEHAVVVYISCLAAHAEPSGVGHGLPDDITERSVAVISIQLIRNLEIVSDEQVGQSVLVEVPPNGRVADSEALNAGTP